jgi:hypothetical protein
MGSRSELLTECRQCDGIGSVRATAQGRQSDVEAMGEAG